MRTAIIYLALCFFNISLLAMKTNDPSIFDAGINLDYAFPRTETVSPYDLWLGQERPEDALGSLVNEREQLLCRFDNNLRGYVRDLIVKARTNNTYVVIHRCGLNNVVLSTDEIDDAFIITKKPIKDSWAIFDYNKVTLKRDSFTKKLVMQLKTGKHKKKYPIFHDHTLEIYQSRILQAQHEFARIALNMTALKSYSHQKYLPENQLIQLKY